MVPVKPVLPDVLAARYASQPMVELWSPEHKVVLERRAVGGGAARPSATSGVDIPAEAIDDYRAVVDAGRPGLDRGPRAGHPPRRQGPHRGVLGPRRPRARPQGHDVARPHRERRAAAGPPGARAGPRPHGHRAGPAGRAGGRARHAGHGRPQPQRRRPGHDARQAVRQRRRGAAAGLPTASTTCSPATRCGASRARSAPSRTSSTCSTATPPRSTALEAGRRRATSASTGALTNVGQVYPRSLDFDVVAALVQAAAGPASLATTIRLMAGHELVTEGFAAGQVGSLGHAPQDEHPVAASGSTAWRSCCGAT